MRALTSLLLLALPASALADPIGLSLWWEDGQVRYEDGTSRTVTLYGDERRFVHELDLTASVVTDTDQGIEPLLHSGDLADLDWAGIEQVDEDWRPEFSGGFTRSRFYRGATWMERPSIFMLAPLDARGRLVGIPIVAYAGRDDRMTPLDDGFVRRFVARQVTVGCQAIGDCSNATSFQAQALVQLRGERNAAQRAVRIPRQATQLQLIWSEDLLHPRTVPVQHAALSSTPYRYGFQAAVEVVNPPANGRFYVAGESLTIRSTFRDGAGTRLHPLGSMPTYGQFLDHAIPSGLRYYDGLRQLLTAYYAMKHREGLAIVSLGGPTQKLKQSRHQVGFNDLFFSTQTVTASVEEDGFTGLFQLNPPIENQAVPELFYAPVSDSVTFTLPLDALPGTYVIATKGRRDWGGEALNAGATAEIQVGQRAPTAFTPTTGRCTNCHVGDSALGSLLHGISDRRSCYGCHPSMAFEPDHALDYRIHLVHSRSERFPGNVNDCSTCHLVPPTGAPRGFPGIGPF